MTVRLQNVLSHAGVCSRRHAAELVAAGRVTVNGRVVTEAGFRTDPGHDAVAVDGRPLSAPLRRRTIMLCKPVGVLSAMSDPFGGRTVCDIVPPAKSERLVPAGRLDKDSEGLLLMSNDGDLVLRLTHPRYGHEKLYLARVAGRWSPEKLATLRSPLEIDGVRIRPCKVEMVREGVDNVHDLLFRLKEGRKRQIRKMCSCAHLVVLALKRVAEGPLVLGGLRPGEWRDLDPAELAALSSPNASAPPSLPPGEWPPHYEQYPADGQCQPDSRRPADDRRQTREWKRPADRRHEREWQRPDDRRHARDRQYPPSGGGAPSASRGGGFRKPSRPPADRGDGFPSARKSRNRAFGRSPRKDRPSGR